MLGFDGSCQNGQLSELNDLSASLICSSFDSTVAESESTDQLSLLDQLLSSLCTKSLTDIGRIYKVPPVKILIDLSSLFPELINIL